MICVPVNISGAYDSVNVNLGTFANNEICFMADVAGFYTLNIEAFAECNSMPSSAVVEVRIDPRLVCPDNLDTLLCEATTLAFDYESSVLVDSIKVTAPAYLENGQVMVPIDVDGIYYCPHHPNDNCDCRKPNTGLIEKAVEDLDIDLQRSYMIGDRMLDVEAGYRMGLKTVLIPENWEKVRDEMKMSPVKPDYICDSFYKGVKWIQQ